jgi:hypothetical protein
VLRQHGVPEEVECDDGAWFVGNVSATLTTVAALYRQACDPEQDHPGRAEFLERMAWLPALIADLEQGRARLDA